MLGEQLAREVLDNKLRSLLTPEFVASILQDGKAICDRLLADPAILAAVASRLKIYFGV